MPKHFVLDTNVLLHDPNGVLMAFKEHTIIIPIIVIEELDKLKHDPAVGYDAREITRQIEELRCSVPAGNLADGIRTKGGGILRVDSNHIRWDDLPIGLERKPDNIVVGVAQRLQKRLAKSGQKVILVSKDVNVRLKADAFHVTAEDYENDKTVAADQLYSGVISLPVSGADISEIHRTGFIDVPDSGLIKERLMMMPPNVCCVLETGAEHMTALALFKKSEGLLRLVKKSGKRQPYKGEGIVGVAPRNDKQCLAYDLVLDEDTSCITLMGKAGTGKTLMAILAGVELLRRKRFTRLIIFRPNVEMGEPMGFLPGDIKEKFAPWAEPAVDCLNLALKGTGKTPLNMVEKGELDILPFNYIRGKTYMDALVIIDEAQNLTPHVVKTAVTRMGERSKMVLTGDLTQIDCRYLDAQSNGLAHVIDRFPGQEIYGHLTLTKSERSNLAEIAARLL